MALETTAARSGFMGHCLIRKAAYLSHGAQTIQQRFHCKQRGEHVAGQMFFSRDSLPKLSKDRHRYGWCPRMGYFSSPQTIGIWKQRPRNKPDSIKLCLSDGFGRLYQMRGKQSLDPHKLVCCIIFFGSLAK
jgi:hypothetical protein